MLVYNKNEARGCSSVSLASAVERTSSNIKSPSVAAAAAAAPLKHRPKSQKQTHRKHCKPLSSQILLRPENILFLKAQGYHT